VTRFCVCQNTDLFTTYSRALEDIKNYILFVSTESKIKHMDHLNKNIQFCGSEAPENHEVYSVYRIRYSQTPVT